MKIELTFKRGVRIWVDGIEPNKEWSIGGEDNEFTTSDLKVGGMEITGMCFDVDPFTDSPSRITLNTSDGKLGGKMIKKAVEEEVTLVNGEKIEIDECTAYFLFEVNPV